MGVPRHWLDKRMQTKATLIELMLRVLAKTERLSAVMAVVRPLSRRNSSAVVVHSSDLDSLAYSENMCKE